VILLYLKIIIFNLKAKLLLKNLFIYVPTYGGTSILLRVY
jgi:hypothetical protein